MVRSQPGQIFHETLFRKTPTQKRAGGLAQGVGPEFKPQDSKKKKIENQFNLNKFTPEFFMGLHKLILKSTKKKKINLQYYIGNLKQ
jgi:hypothetical protein